MTGATIAHWICLHLPSCRPGFESQAHHLCFYQFIFELCDVGKDFMVSNGIPSYVPGVGGSISKVKQVMSNVHAVSNSLVQTVNSHKHHLYQVRYYLLDN